MSYFYIVGPLPYLSTSGVDSTVRGTIAVATMPLVALWPHVHSSRMGKLHPAEGPSGIGRQSGLIRIDRDHENRVSRFPFQDVDRIAHDFDAD